MVVTAAWLLFVECSLQHYETANAWYAAGVGTQSTCTEVLKTNTISLDEVSVYPNPFSNNITVNFKKSQNFTIKLFNITGKLVYSNQIYTSNATVSLPDLSRGVYIVELKDENTTVRKKIIKQ